MTATLLTGSLCLAVLISSGCGHGGAINQPRTQTRTVIQNIGSDTMVNLAQAWA
jgi:ABC-type phosphate transport system substrate-binding protein